MTFETIFGPTYEALTALSTKPIIVSETGSAEQGGDKAAWIVDTYSKQLPTKFPRILAVSWFNATANGTTGGDSSHRRSGATSHTTDWRINTSDASLDALVRVAHSPYLEGSLPLLDAAERIDDGPSFARAGSEAEAVTDAVSVATPTVPSVDPQRRQPQALFGPVIPASAANARAPCSAPTGAGDVTRVLHTARI